MNVAILLPKSGVSIRRRLGRGDAVPWPRERRSHARSRSVIRSHSISLSGSPEPLSVPLHSPNVVPLHSPNVVALPQTGVQIYGKTFTKDFGMTFAPFRHNWMYAVKPEQLSFQLLMLGGNFLKLVEFYSGIAATGNYKPAQTNDMKVMEQRFVDDWIPMLDEGLRKMSIRGTISFVVEWLVLGVHYGFTPGFLFYTLFQIVNTEGLSYLADSFNAGSFTGNSMFAYANTGVCWLLVNKLRGKSGWPLLLYFAYTLWDFYLQFSVPAASTRLHFLGLFLGWVGYLLFL